MCSATEIILSVFSATRHIHDPERPGPDLLSNEQDRRVLAAGSRITS